MAVLLDTTSVAPRQRARAMAEWLEAQCGAPARVDYPCPPAETVHRMTSWRLGPLTAAQSRGSATRIVRGAREVRLTEHPQLLISYFAEGTTRGRAAATGDFTFRRGDVLLHDMERPFVMDWPDGHDLWGLTIPCADLAVPEDVLHRALVAPPAGPVYPVLRRHVARVCAVLPDVDNSPAADALGQVTVDLLRAVLNTAGAPAPEAREHLQDSLPLRLERYLLEHLGEASLSVGDVAAAHFVSVRQVHYAWSSRHDDEGLAEWVMSRRLERAARQLRTGADPVGTVAHRCGFADATHFSRRFRARFGMAPRQWRAAGQADTRQADTQPP